MNTLEHAARQALEMMDAGSYIPAMRVLREALKPNREGKYYYKDNACTASSADSPDCICWHDEALAEQAEQEPECKYKEAYIIWQDKTEWVQETAHPKELGMHRADVLRQRIENLQNAATHPVRTVDLTDDEIYTLYSEPCSDREMIEFARAVIAAFKEKNLIK